MLGRTPTQEEKAWMDTVAQVGCIVCIVYHERAEDFGQSYCEIHHIDGSRKAGCHLQTIGLCEKHHRHKDTIQNRHGHTRWVSRHGDGKAAFEDRYATEKALLTIQRRLNQRFDQLVAVSCE